MRILILIIAVLALVGGLIHLLGGMVMIFSAISVMTSTSSLPSEYYNQLPHDPVKIGLALIGVAFLMLINGALFSVFSIGTFMWKKWARVLGIVSYVLNIIVAFAAYLTGVLPGEFSWIFGTFVAITFIIILSLGKSAYERPMA